MDDELGSYIIVNASPPALSAHCGTSCRKRGNVSTRRQRPSTLPTGVVGGILQTQGAKISTVPTPTAPPAPLTIAV
jgi:hypothetical protein